MKVVELRPDLPCDDIVQGLRNIADQIEAGEFAFTPTMAVIVLGDESVERTRDMIIDRFSWQSHGLGKTSYFAAKGLLAAALNRSEGGV